MRPIPKKLRDELAADPFMKQCLRLQEGTCKGRITWEHAWSYANRQINEKWAIVPLCEHHHFVDLKKHIGQLASLNRATKEDLAKYSRKDWGQIKKSLEKKSKTK